MKVLIVYAHPDPRSLNGALRDVAVRELQKQGHEVQVSDLYAMGWKATLDHSDFETLKPEERLIPVKASKEAFQADTLSEDVKGEIQKLLWADTVILQFPLWWFTMPAILKGWVDRVFAYGFAYGVGEHNDVRWGDRYGEGTLAGKRAMVMVTIGGWEAHYAPFGINGRIDDILFPINHGILYYPGFDVLPPFTAYRVDQLDEEGFRSLSDRLKKRLKDLEVTPPIPYRLQNGGDYDIPSMQLRSHLRDPNVHGFALHVRPSDK